MASSGWGLLPPQLTTLCLCSDNIFGNASLEGSTAASKAINFLSELGGLRPRGGLL